MIAARTTLMRIKWSWRRWRKGQNKD